MSLDDETERAAFVAWANEIESFGTRWERISELPPLALAQASWNTGRAPLLARIAELEAKIAAAKMDAWRYEWLRGATRMIDASIKGMLTIYAIYDDDAPSEIRDDLDACIDAAISADREESP